MIIVCRGGKEENFRKGKLGSGGIVVRVYFGVGIIIVQGEGKKREI